MNFAPQGSGAWLNQRVGCLTASRMASAMAMLKSGKPSESRNKLMIEILAAAVTGSAFGWEASSFFDDQGGPPNLGHVLIALDAGRLSAGAYDERMATLLAAIAAEPDARLPGTRRLANRRGSHRTDPTNAGSLPR